MQLSSQPTSLESYKKTFKPQLKLKTFLRNIQAPLSQISISIGHQASNRIVPSDRYKQIESSRYGVNHNVSNSIRLKNQGLSPLEFPQISLKKKSQEHGSINITKDRILFPVFERTNIKQIKHNKSHILNRSEMRKQRLVEFLKGEIPTNHFAQMMSKKKFSQPEEDLLPQFIIRKYQDLQF